MHFQYAKGRLMRESVKDKFWLAACVASTMLLVMIFWR